MTPPPPHFKIFFRNTHPCLFDPPPLPVLCQPASPTIKHRRVRKENEEFEAEKSLTNFIYDNISLKEQLFKCLNVLPKTSFDTLWNFVDPG